MLIDYINTKSNQTKGYLFFALLVIGVLVYVSLKTDLFYLLRNDYYTSVKTVNGLNIGDSIKYRGLTIGKVYAIKIDDNDFKIEFYIQNKYNALIKEDSQLKLATPMGITSSFLGIHFELVPGKGKLRDPNDKFIQTRSQLSKTDGELASMASDVQTLVAKVTTLISAIEETEIQRIMKSSGDFTEQLHMSAVKLDKGLDHYIKLGASLNSSSHQLEQDLPQMLTQVKDSLLVVETLLKSSNNTVQNIDDLTDNMNTVVTEASTLIIKVQVILDQVDSLTYKLNNHWLMGGGNQKKEKNPQLHLFNE